MTAKNVDVTFELEATLAGSGITDVVALKLIPAISVSPASLSIAVEHLASQTITVAGLDKVLQVVSVKSSHPTVLEVTAVSKTPGRLEFGAKLIGNLPTSESVVVHIVSPLSQQSIDIVIGVPAVTAAMNGRCSAGSGSPPSWQSVGAMLVNMVSNIGLIISALIALAVAIWGKFEGK